MKIRLGFVSNSSSSSFLVVEPESYIRTLIVTSDEGTTPEKIEVNLKEYVEEIYWSRKEFKRYQGYSYLEKGTLEEVDNILDSGKAVVVMTFDGYGEGGDALSNFIRDNCDAFLSGIKIIERRWV